MPSTIITFQRTKENSSKEFTTGKQYPTLNPTFSEKNFRQSIAYSDTIMDSLITNSTTMIQPSSQLGQTTPTTRTTLGRTRISFPQNTTTALLDLSWYINNIYGPQHSVTTKQADGTYHIYQNIQIGEISGIQYNLNRKRFEPKEVHLDLDYLQRALEEYQFLDTFAEDPEISKEP